MMSVAHQVPVARRNMWSEPRRLIASASGVGLALMLILLLDGLWAGIEEKTTLYEDNSGADLYIAQPGAKNLFSTISVKAGRSAPKLLKVSANCGTTQISRMVVTMIATRTTAAG